MVSRVRAVNDALAVPAFRDNYIWLVPGPEPRDVAIIDPGLAEPVIDAVEQRGLRPALILCTHHHGDHTGGIEPLAARYHIPVYAPAAEAIPGTTIGVRDGQTLETPIATFRVIGVPGHTRGHVAYLSDERLFCGDTLFSAGCGRLFEGTAFQMHASLMRLAALPPETRVYCAHEYTLSNLRFARHVEPDNDDILQCERRARRLRDAGQPTLPSTIADERRINPFLRAQHASVRAHVMRLGGQRSDTDAAVFATLRRWKDDFQG